MLTKLIIITIQAIEIYSYMVLIWVIGSWFPQFQNNKFYRFIDQAVEPYARIFRRIIPPIGGFDFSIIIGFFVLSIMQRLLAAVAMPL